MTAEVVGNVVSFEGYATSATIAGSTAAINGTENTFASLFNGKALWSAVMLTNNGWNSSSTVENYIKQQNKALDEAYSGIYTDSTRAQKYTFGSSDYGYAFLIPKYSNDAVTVSVYNGESEVADKLQQTFVFDFSRVSTKIVLDDALKAYSNLTRTESGKGHDGWTYTGSSDYRLTLANYTGKEIFYGGDNLNVVFSGTNSINAYGTADLYDSDGKQISNGSHAIKAKVMTIKSTSADNKLTIVQNTENAFNVRANTSVTIGDSSGAMTVIDLSGGNRAINTGTVTFVNTDATLSGSEKAVKASDSGAITLENSSVVANLSDEIAVNGGEVDDRFGVKTGSISVGAGSILVTEGLRVTGNAITETPGGLIQVKGGYNQYEGNTLDGVFAGLYLDKAASNVSVIRATPASDAKGFYLTDGAEAYNIAVKDPTGKVDIKTDTVETVAQETGDTTTIVSEIKAGGEATNISEAITEAVSQIELVKDVSGATGISVQVVVPIQDDSTKLNVTSAAITALKNSGAELAVRSSAATVSLDNNVVSTLSSGSADVVIVVTPEPTALTTAQKSVVGTDTVIDVSAYVGGEQLSKLNGTATISVPYQAKGTVKVTYVKDDGSVENVPCTYSGGVVTFTTDHFSLYVFSDSSFTPSFIPVPDNRGDDFSRYVPTQNTDSASDDSAKIAVLVGAIVVVLVAIVALVHRSR